MKRLIILLGFALSLLTVIPTQAANFSVGTVADLITAINDANASVADDTITLTANIVLLAPNNTFDGNTGTPVIQDNGTLTINGAGFTISRGALASDNFRLLYVNTGAVVTINDLILTDGLTSGGASASTTNQGGAIFNAGTLTINNSSLLRNTSNGSGGAIENKGTLNVLNGTTVGGIFGVDGNVSGEHGGGIRSDTGSTLLIDNSYIYGNRAGSPGAGVQVQDATVTIQNGSRIGGAGGLGNRGTQSGGGAALFGSTVTISNSTIEGNFTSSVVGGGGLSLSGSTTTMDNVIVIDNSTNSTGGGVRTDSGTTTIRNSTISNNGAGSRGDGIHVGSSSTVNANTLIVDNSTIATTNNDAIYLESFHTANIPSLLVTVTISDSTVIATGGMSAINVNNTVYYPTLTTNLSVTNSTLQSSGSAPTINVNDTLGFIALNGTSNFNTTLRNVSIVNAGASGYSINSNTATAGAVGNYNMDIANSFIEGAVGANDCTTNFIGTGTSNITQTGNNNLTTGTNCLGGAGGFTATTSAALNLQALADNGGPTNTVAFLAPSSALNTSGASATSNDQRGALASLVRDIGAYEANSPVPSVSYTVSEPVINESTGITSTTVSVTLADYANLPVSTSFSLTGSASSADYTIVGNPNMTFNANGTSTFVIEGVADGLIEADETINLELFISGSATLSGSATQTVTIISPDRAPVTATATEENTESSAADTNPNIDVFDPAISKIGFLVPGQVGVTGEELEWIVTVSNTGNAIGNNVVVTDTLIDALRVDSVNAPNAIVGINGQTVTVTYPVLNIGETQQFSIFTTVLDGVTVNNTACVNADNQGTEECSTSTTPITQLPNTGEVPFWTIWFLVLSGVLVLLGAGFVGYRMNRQ